MGSGAGGRTGDAEAAVGLSAQGVLWSQLAAVAFICGAVGAAAVADANGGQPTAGVFAGFVAGFAAPFVVVLVVKL